MPLPSPSSPLSAPLLQSLDDLSDWLPVFCGDWKSLCLWFPFLTHPNYCWAMSTTNSFLGQRTRITLSVSDVVQAQSSRLATQLPDVHPPPWLCCCGSITGPSDLTSWLSPREPLRPVTCFPHASVTAFPLATQPVLLSKPSQLRYRWIAFIKPEENSHRDSLVLSWKLLYRLLPWSATPASAFLHWPLKWYRSGFNLFVLAVKDGHIVSSPYQSLLLYEQVLDSCLRPAMLSLLSVTSSNTTACFPTAAPRVSHKHLKAALVLQSPP